MKKKTIIRIRGTRPLLTKLTKGEALQLSRQLNRFDLPFHVYWAVHYKGVIVGQIIGRKQ